MKKPTIRFERTVIIVIKYSELGDNEKALLNVLRDNIVKNVLPFNQAYAKNWEFFEMIHTDYLDDFQRMVDGEMDVKSFVSTYHLEYDCRVVFDLLYDEYYDIYPEECFDDDDYDNALRSNQIAFIEHWSDEDISLPAWDFQVYDAIVEEVKDKKLAEIYAKNWERFLKTASRIPISK